MSKTINASYENQDRLKGEFCYRIFDDHYLEVVHKQGKKRQGFRLDIATLSPDFQRCNNIAWHWLAAVVFFTSATVAFVYYAVHNIGLERLQDTLYVIALFFVVSVVAVLLFKLDTARKVTFRTRHANYPLVEVIWCRDREQSFNEFVDMLAERARVIPEQRKLSDEVLCAGEVKMLRRLKNKGIVANNSYEKAKQVIFKHTHPSAVL